MRIKLARSAGFGLAELHDDWTTAGLKDALSEAGCSLVSLNTDHHGEAFGVASDPGSAAKSRDDIAAAAGAGADLGARALHVLAGRNSGSEARAAFEAALTHALDIWPGTVLVEPLSPGAVPGYHVASVSDARAVLDRVAHPRLKIMFDTFHIGMTEADLCAAFASVAEDVGHIQIAAVPTRAEPDTGTVDLPGFLETAHRCGYRGDVGVEFVPASGTPRLDWLADWSRRLEGFGL